MKEFYIDLLHFLLISSALPLRIICVEGEDREKGGGFGDVWLSNCLQESVHYDFFFQTKYSVHK